MHTPSVPRHLWSWLRLFKVSINVHISPRDLSEQKDPEPPPAKVIPLRPLPPSTPERKAA